MDRGIFYSSREKAHESCALFVGLIGTQPSDKLPLLDATPAISKLSGLRYLESRVASSHRLRLSNRTRYTSPCKLSTQPQRDASDGSVNAEYSAGSKFDFQFVSDGFFAGIRVDVPIFDFVVKIAGNFEGLVTATRVQSTSEEA